MVLAELGQKITGALRKMRDAKVIDQSVIDEMLKDICNALVTADVNFKMVLALRESIKKQLDLENMATGLDRRRTANKVVFDELVKLLDPGTKPWKPHRGKSNVIMFVGLQGSGKTTTVTKMANHYKKKNWRPALVCADTFRAAAYEQLSQNAARVKIPLHGSTAEKDPVKIAKEGVDKFKAEGHDIIIVDTSGRHKQEASLFEEMEQVATAVEPDQIIFVMDGTIGQNAHDQALAFKQKVNVGAVIITKLDGHAKGGGALSAVAATKSPVIFIGTGENIFGDFLEFDVHSFVSRLLGLGDWKGMLSVIQDAVPKDSQPKMAKRLQEGKFSLRDMYEQFQNMLRMGPLDQVMDMLPDTGLNQLLKGAGGEAGTSKIKGFMTIMDSMTDQELDFPKVLNATRILRVAKGSGKSVREVNELLAQHKQFEKVVEKMKGMRPGRQGINQMQKMVPPHLLKQMGGAGQLNSLMRQMGGMEGMKGFK